MADKESRGRSLFERLAHATTNASVFIQRTAASASEVLSDAELRRKAGLKIVDGARAGVKGIQGGLQGGLQGLEFVGRNLVLNVGGGLQSGRRGVQGVLERVQMQLEQRRLLRALAVEKDMPVNIQIGFHVYEGAPQEIRSRYWVVLANNPALAKPFQELGRFPDIGDFDPDLRHQESIERAARGGESDVFVTKPVPKPTDEAVVDVDPAAGAAALAELLGTAAAARPEAEREEDDSQIPDISESHALLSAAPAHDSPLASPSHQMLRGGEGLDDSLVDARNGSRASNHGRETSGTARNGDDGWEVVDKLDPLVESSFVGPATLAHPTRQSEDSVTRDPPALGGGPHHPHDSSASATSSQHGAEGQESASAAAERTERRSLKRQAQARAAKRLHDATETLKTAMSALDWPVTHVPQNGPKYEILLQMTVGQEDVEEIIRRDIHRTFPEHPHFLLGQGQESLYNLLKAYSVTDLMVGYCQGMAFVAGILLMYLPEQPAFKVFCELMNPSGPNLRRFYLPGLDDLKLEMAKFEWLLERHHPKLFQHLQTNGVPCVLYASQWLLTVFACPFPVEFTARIIDIMLMEQTDHIVMQTAMAVMAECEAMILSLNDFEDIITYLKTEPCEWDNAKLQGLISAAYLSSVSDSELTLANEVVTLERVERMMAKPAGRPSREKLPVAELLSQVSIGARTPERITGDQPAAEEGSARRSMVDMDDGLITLVMEQELEHLKWAGPSKEHSLIDADIENAVTAPCDLPLVAT